MKTTARKLPPGICFSHYFNACDRAKKDISKARYHYSAYAGMGKHFRAKRFFIDKLGDKEAFAQALAWRKKHSDAPLGQRDSDLHRKENRKKRLTVRN